MKSTTQRPIIVALDFDEMKDAQQLVEQLDPTQCRLKVGKAMFTQFGPEFVRNLVARGFDVFLDLKFHDIPHQVASACRAAAALGVWMIDVHASGGLAMMQAARQAVDECDHRPLLLAVTLLTSLSQEDMNQIGFAERSEDQVLRLARLASDGGLDGVVCSAREASCLRQHLAKNFILVTPGIRLASANSDDQERIVTPQKALALGSDYLVIGRPITQARDPMAVIAKISNLLSQ